MKLQNENLEADTLTHFQYALRIDYLNYYFISLKKALEAGQVSPSRFQFSNLLVLMDATLLGTGAERVSGNIYLFYFHIFSTSSSLSSRFQPGRAPE